MNLEEQIPLVFKIVNRYFMGYTNRDDLIEAGMVALVIAFKRNPEPEIKWLINRIRNAITAEIQKTRYINPYAKNRIRVIMNVKHKEPEATSYDGYTELKEELLALAEDEKDKALIELAEQGYTETEIGKRIGMSQTGISYRKARLWAHFTSSTTMTTDPVTAGQS